MDVLLYNPEDPSNFGSIIRTSLALSMNRIYIYDSFGILRDKKNIDRVRGVCRNGRENRIIITEVDEPVDFINLYKNKYATVISKNSRKLGYDKPDVEFLTDPLIIFGNEREGIPRKISHMKGIERIVIPIVNVDEPFSLPVAYGIILYEFMRQQKSLPEIKKK
jgi:tRNA(Leu) C34 or U34 (ribose-2'-O)-methylase TrmL